MVPREESDETITEVDETSVGAVVRVEVGAEVVTGATLVVDEADEVEGMEDDEGVVDTTADVETGSDVVAGVVVIRVDEASVTIDNETGFVVVLPGTEVDPAGEVVAGTVLDTPAEVVGVVAAACDVDVAAALEIAAVGLVWDTGVETATDVARVEVFKSSNEHCCGEIRIRFRPR
jgi:hypothetical protein